MRAVSIPLAEPPGFKRSPLLEDTRTRFFVITSNIGENVVKSVQHNVWATQRKNEQKLNEAFRTSSSVILIFAVNKSGAFQGYARMRSPTERSKCKADPFRGFGRLFDVEWLRLHDLALSDVQNLKNPLDDNRQVGSSRDGQELTHSAGSELCRQIDIRVFHEDSEGYEPITDDPSPTLRDPEPTTDETQPWVPPAGMSKEQLALTAPADEKVTLDEKKPLPMIMGAPPPSAPPQRPHVYQREEPPRPPAGYYAAAPGHHQPMSQYMHWPPPPPGIMPYPASSSPWSGYQPQRERKRRRDRSSSYSSESETRDRKRKKKDKKKKHKKNKDKKDKRRNDREPDFEKISYEDYVKWWQQKHNQAPSAAGGTSVSAQPLPAANGVTAHAAVPKPVVQPLSASVPMQNVAPASATEQRPEKHSKKKKDKKSKKQKQDEKHPQHPAEHTAGPASIFEMGQQSSAALQFTSPFDAVESRGPKELKARKKSRKQSKDTSVLHQSVTPAPAALVLKPAEASVTQNGSVFTQFIAPVATVPGHPDVSGTPVTRKRPLREPHSPLPFRPQDRRLKRAEDAERKLQEIMASCAPGNGEIPVNGVVPSPTALTSACESEAIKSANVEPHSEVPVTGQACHEAPAVSIVPLTSTAGSVKAADAMPLDESTKAEAVTELKKSPPADVITAPQTVQRLSPDVATTSPESKESPKPVPEGVAAEVSLTSESEDDSATPSAESDIEDSNEAVNKPVAPSDNAATAEQAGAPLASVAVPEQVGGSSGSESETGEAPIAGAIPGENEVNTGVKSNSIINLAAPIAGQDDGESCKAAIEASTPTVDTVVEQNGDRNVAVVDQNGLNPETICNAAADAKDGCDGLVERCVRDSESESESCEARAWANALGSSAAVRTAAPQTSNAPTPERAKADIEKMPSAAELAAALVAAGADNDDEDEEEAPNCLASQDDSDASSVGFVGSPDAYGKD